MEEDSNLFTEGEVYQQLFESRTYVETYYSSTAGHKDEINFQHFILQNLSRTFSSGHYRGQRLIDIGTGPSIHSLISACQHFEEICVSDFADSNLEEIKMWLNKEDGCFNWNPVIQFVCGLEGNSRSPSQAEQQLRQRVKQVLHCDVRLDNPFHPVTVEPADCITTSLCLEAACKDLEAYRRSLQSVSALLRPGGALVMVGVLGETFYLVGGKRFSCLPLTRSYIEGLLLDLTFSLKEFNVLYAHKKNNSTYDFEAMFQLVAIKDQPN